MPDVVEMGTAAPDAADAADAAPHPDSPGVFGEEHSLPPPSSLEKRFDRCKMGSESEWWILGMDRIRLSTEAKTCGNNGRISRSY